MKPIYDIELHTPRLNEEFAAYLDGKSVAIVGRSGIHDMEQGKFIDSHDVVVRVHWAVPYLPANEIPADNTKAEYNDPAAVSQFVPEDWHSRLGKRVDILYHRLRSNNPFYVSKWLAAFRRSGGKFVCCDSTAHQDAFPDAYPQRYMPIRYVSWEMKCAIILKINQTPDAGLVCICDVLSHNIKSAYITGFPCLADKDIDPNLPHARQNRRPRIEGLQFLCDLGSDARVQYDDRMLELFKKHCR